MVKWFGIEARFPQSPEFISFTAHVQMNEAGGPWSAHSPDVMDGRSTTATDFSRIQKWWGESSGSRRAG